MIDQMAKIVKKKSQQAPPKKVKSAKAEDLKFSGSVKCLLFSHGETVEDKIATVKTSIVGISLQFKVINAKLTLIFC